MTGFDRYSQLLDGSVCAHSHNSGVVHITHIFTLLSTSLVFLLYCNVLCVPSGGVDSKGQVPSETNDPCDMCVCLYVCVWSWFGPWETAGRSLSHGWRGGRWRWQKARGAVPLYCPLPRQHHFLRHPSSWPCILTREGEESRLSICACDCSVRRKLNQKSSIGLYTDQP